MKSSWVITIERSYVHASTGPLSDLRYRQVQLDWWSTLCMRARHAPLLPTTADCHLDYFPACMPPRPTEYRWLCGSEMGWHQPDGCQHRADTSPNLIQYAMFIRNIKQWYDKMVLWLRNYLITKISSYFDVIRALSLRHIYLYIDFESLNNNYLRLETKQKWYGIEKRPSHYFTVPLIYNHIECLVQDCSDFIANALELLSSYIKPSI